MKFKYAFNGLKLCFKDKAVIIQIVLGILAIIGGLIIKLDHYEWLVFIICIGFVITSEIFNLCIERLCNLYTKEYDERIKFIKDVSAAAVTISALASLIVCVLCVIRRLS